jgi:hypothetical protein
MAKKKAAAKSKAHGAAETKASSGTKKKVPEPPQNLHRREEWFRTRTGS